MFPVVLFLHSYMRWLVLTSLIFTIAVAFNGWISGRKFSRFDNALRHWTATIAHIQLLIGLWLYIVSPIITYFLHNYTEAVHVREIRFFGMEHSVMMFTAIAIITMGSAKAKCKQTDREKFKTVAVWFTVALLIILMMIPWVFSPLVHRPYFRTF